jgi:hypothetical protein
VVTRRTDKSITGEAYYPRQESPIRCGFWVERNIIGLFSRLKRVWFQLFRGFSSRQRFRTVTLRRLSSRRLSSGGRNEPPRVYGRIGAILRFLLRRL